MLRLDSKTESKQFYYFAALIEDRMEIDLGSIEVDLDGRFSIVRTQESNLGRRGSYNLRSI